MRFSHCIRAAPFEFCLYAFAALVIVGYVGGLLMVASGILVPLWEVVVVLAIVGLIPAFFAAAFAPVILLARRWRRRNFCRYEFAMHLILSLPLATTIWFLFDTTTRIA